VIGTLGCKLQHFLVTLDLRASLSKYGRRFWPIIQLAMSIPVILLSVLWNVLISTHVVGTYYLFTYSLSSVYVLFGFKLSDVYLMPKLI